MKTRLDISEDIGDFKDAKYFGKEMIMYWASGFLLGCFVGSFLLWLALNLFVG